jgi:hypothetical protein
MKTQTDQIIYYTSNFLFTLGHNKHFLDMNISLCVLYRLLYNVQSSVQMNKRTSGSEREEKFTKVAGNYLHKEMLAAKQIPITAGWQ